MRAATVGDVEELAQYGALLCPSSSLPSLERLLDLRLYFVVSAPTVASQVVSDLGIAELDAFIREECCPYLGTRLYFSLRSGENVSVEQFADTALAYLSRLLDRRDPRVEAVLSVSRRSELLRVVSTLKLPPCFVSDSDGARRFVFHPVLMRIVEIEHRLRREELARSFSDTELRGRLMRLLLWQYRAASRRMDDLASASQETEAGLLDLMRHAAMDYLRAVDELERAGGFRVERPRVCTRDGVAQWDLRTRHGFAQTDLRDVRRSLVDATGAAGGLRRERRRGPRCGAESRGRAESPDPWSTWCGASDAPLVPSTLVSMQPLPVLCFPSAFSASFVATPPPLLLPPAAAVDDSVPGGFYGAQVVGPPPGLFSPVASCSRECEVRPWCAVADSERSNPMAFSSCPASPGAQTSLPASSSLGDPGLGSLADVASPVAEQFAVVTREIELRQSLMARCVGQGRAPVWLHHAQDLERLIELRRGLDASATSASSSVGDLGFGAFASVASPAVEQVALVTEESFATVASSCCGGALVAEDDRRSVSSSLPSDAEAPAKLDDIDSVMRLRAGLETLDMQKFQCF